MSNHSTAPTIGEATMTDHSSVDALSDEQVDKRLRTVLRLTPHWLIDDAMFANAILIDEEIFAKSVIPALDERGLGEKYVATVLALLLDVPSELHRLRAQRIPFKDSWAIHKAPLPVRARAALTVFEAGQ